MAQVTKVEREPAALKSITITLDASELPYVKTALAQTYKADSFAYYTSGIARRIYSTLQTGEKQAA